MVKVIKILKNIYAIIIWMLMLIYIVYRREIYFTADITIMDNMVLILFGIFTLLPIFSEVDFMGIRLKREIEKNKMEIDRELLQIRTDINNNILHNSNIINYYVNAPENELKDMEKAYKSAQQEYEDIEIDDISILCLKIRQKVEILLKRIAQKYNVSERNYHLIPLLRVLTNQEVIPDRLYNVLIEIIIICNKSIHGEKISESHSNFIKNTYMKVIKELEEIN